MKRLMKISNNTTLVLCLISIAGLILTNTFFILLRNMITGMGDVESFMTRFSIPVAVAYVIFGFFHLAAILTLVLELKFFKRDNFLRAFLFFTSIVSLLMLLGDSALMSDISKEYVFGLPGEFNILFLSQLLHLIFYILMIVLLISSRKSVRKKGEEIVLKDDAVFINAQYVRYCELEERAWTMAMPSGTSSAVTLVKMLSICLKSKGSRLAETLPRYVRSAR